MLDPLAEPLARLLAFYYDIAGRSYAGAISLLTVTVMVLLLPLTLKQTRSMVAMQKLSPELKKLQDRHKNDREKLAEEMRTLYRDNKINPLSSCFPLLLQLPVFIVLYHLLINLTAEGPDGKVQPKYLDAGTQLFADLRDSGGQMISFGIDLADKAAEDHGSALAAAPFFLLIAFTVLAQYVQQWQMSSRAPAADSPQAEMMKKVQKFFPPFFGVFAITIPAGVVLYWAMSSLFRIVQQWAMYRFDPVLNRTVVAATQEVEGFLKEDKPAAKEKDKVVAKNKTVAATPATKKPPRNTNNKSKKKRKGK